MNSDPSLKDENLETTPRPKIIAFKAKTLTEECTREIFSIKKVGKCTILRKLILLKQKSAKKEIVQEKSINKIIITSLLLTRL